MTDFTEHSVIGQAADLIVEYGFAVGKFVDNDGCLCALGALSLVIYGDPIAASIAPNYHDDPGRLYLDAVFLLQSHLAESGDPVYRAVGSVSAWSDAAGADAVVAAMRAAAAGGER
jgi:hypothetical protein